LPTDPQSLKEILKTMCEKSDPAIKKTLETLVGDGDLSVPIPAKKLRKEAATLLSALKGSLENED